MVQWLRPRAANSGGMGSIPGRETEIPRALLSSQKILKYMYIDMIVLFLIHDLGMK